MTETGVITEVCASCGVERREGADFCYACGKALVGTEETAEAPMPEILAETEPEGKEPAVEEAKPAKRMRSASSLRRRAKAVKNEPVEIVWVSGDGPNVGFIVTSIVLLALTILIIFAAMYLR